MLKQINYASNLNNATSCHSSVTVPSTDLMTLVVNEAAVAATIAADLQADDAVYANMQDSSDELIAIVKQARAAFSMAKENASWAAAHTYVLWLKTTASDGAEYWFSKEVTARNSAIFQSNKKREESSWPADPINGLAAGEKWSKINAREGTSKFNRVVKYALDFVHPKQATNVSRYVLVMEWLHDNFGATLVSDASVLAKAINAAGGFETVVRMQRAQKSKVVTQVAQKTKADHVDKYAVIEQARCLYEVNLDAKHCQKGVVVLVGRFAEGRVQIVGELKIAADHLDKAVANIDEMYFQPAENQMNAA